MTLLFPLCTRLSSPPTPRSGISSVGPVRELLACGQTCRRTQCKLERWWTVESSDSSRRRHRALLSVVCSSSRRRSDVVIASSSRRRIVVTQAFNEKPRRNWWQRVLFQRIDNWQNTKLEDEEDEDLEIPDYEENAEEEDYVLSDAELDFDLMEEEEEEADMDEIDMMIEDDAKFEAWKSRRDVLNELREFQETGRDPDGLEWEDWLDDSWRNGTEDGVGGKDGVGEKKKIPGVDEWWDAAPEWEKGGVPRDAPPRPERGMKRTVKEIFLRIFEREEEVEDDLQFEDRIFRYTSQTTAKFVACLILIPWSLDFVAHDFIFVPFLGRYVETVPLAGQVLDVRESQKLKIIEKLKLERQRVRFEAEIGKTPPLSDDELAEHIQHEAMELREEFRLENREAFANIWSDFAAGLTFLILLVVNPEQVAIMRLTGDRLFTNISDTGKAFTIILLTDIFLGYHSESGWETVSEIVLDHYGFEVSQAAIYIFVAIVPVTIDACFKLWVFQMFRRLSPSASATFRQMKRH
ncbi:unnamed protein product [Sphagnum troendelagicum]